MLGILLVVIGVLAIVAGIFYMTQPAHALPSILPGYLAHSMGKHTKRGILADAIGAVLLVVGTAVAVSGARRPRW